MNIIDECKQYIPIKWTIRTDRFSSFGCTEAETEEEARKIFLEKNDEYTDKDITYCRPSGRFTYSTVGYGVFSIMGHFYASGRVEIYDREDNSGYAIDEGSYWAPVEDEFKVRDFFDDLETSKPMEIKVGHFKECQKAVSEETGIPVDKLHDEVEVKKFNKKKHQDWLDNLSEKDRKSYDETAAGFKELEIEKK